MSRIDIRMDHIGNHIGRRYNTFSQAYDPIASRIDTSLNKFIEFDTMVDSTLIYNAYIAIIAMLVYYGIA